MKQRRLLVALTSLAAIASAAAVLGTTAYGSGKGGAVVKTMSVKPFGTILVNGSGQTLYLNTADTPKHFSCTAGCAQAWPPLETTGKPKAQGSAKSSLLGTLKGPDGKTWVTYNHHQLYTFTSDSKGRATGEGVNSFFVVNASGNKISHAPNSSSTTTTTSSSSSSGYHY